MTCLDSRMQKWREETPGCKHVVHFNNAGASLQPQPVIDAVQQYTAEEAIWGGYETATRRAEELQRPSTALAQLLNCSPQEIALVGSATSAWGQVFFGIPFKQGDVILTSQAEYGSNYLAYLQAQKRFGVQIQVIPETADGDIDVEALQNMLAQQPKPALVSISHVPTSSGRVYDAAAVGAAAAAAGVPYLLDACQSVGQMPLDVQQLQCDFLTGTSRKYLRGPRGIGFLYARSRHNPASCAAAPTTPGSNGSGSGSSSSTGLASSSNSTSDATTTSIATSSPNSESSSSSSSSSSSTDGWEPAMIDIHGAQWLSADSYSLVEGAARYEQYELNCAAKVGFGAAVEYCIQQDPQACWQATQQLAAHLRQRLRAEVPGAAVQDRGRVLCGIVSFTLASHPDAAAVKVWLTARQPPINVSVSGIGSTRLDFEQRGLHEVLRASVAYYNSEADVAALVSALQELVGSADQTQGQGCSSELKEAGTKSDAAVGTGTPLPTKERRAVC